MIIVPYCTCSAEHWKLLDMVTCFFLFPTPCVHEKTKTENTVILNSMFFFFSLSTQPSIYKFPSSTHLGNFVLLRTREQIPFLITDPFQAGSLYFQTCSENLPAGSRGFPFPCLLLVCFFHCLLGIHISIHRLSL